MGNTDPRYVKLLHRLANIRDSARYLQKDFSLEAEETKDMLATAEDMFVTVRASIPQRHKVSNDS